MASRNIKDLHPALQLLAKEFLDRCQLAGVNAFLTQTFRGVVEQDADYAQGRWVPGHIITNARAGESPHNSMMPDGTPGARAFDFGIRLGNGQLDWDAQDDDWQTAIQIGRAVGLVSGSSFHGLHDNPHMELPDWKNWPGTLA